MKNWRVDAAITVYRLAVDLEAPVAASDPFIHLDSFLSYAAGIESIGFDGIQEMERGDSPLYFEDEMPLEKIKVDGAWVWACSSAQIAAPERDIQEGWSITKWRKRFDTDPLHSVKDTHINITTGSFKSYNASLPYNAIRRLLFFFEGDPDKVEELVRKHIPAIGKKRSQGYGAIKEIEVSEATEMDSAIYHEGHFLRSVPAPFVEGTPRNVRIELRTTKPPYWHADNQTMAYPPFQEISEENVQDEVLNL